MGDDGGFSGDGGGGFSDYSANRDDGDFTSNSFSGKDNGASLDNRYNDEDSRYNNSRDDDKIEHSNWEDPEKNYDEAGNSSRDILSAVAIGGGDIEKTILNGDAVISPMLVDEVDSGRPFQDEPYPERNSCEDCVFGTLVCCDCSIL